MKHLNINKEDGNVRHRRASSHAHNTLECCDGSVDRQNEKINSIVGETLGERVYATRRARQKTHSTQVEQERQRRKREIEKKRMKGKRRLKTERARER